MAMRPPAMHQALTVFGSSMTWTLHSQRALSGRIFTACATSRSRDDLDAIQQPRVGDQLSPLAILVHLLHVCLARRPDGLLLGDQHELLASRGTRGARREHCSERQRCE